MAEHSRKSDLFSIFDGIDDAEKTLIENLLDEVVFLEEQMTELKKMPFIRVNPKMPTLQKTTPAAKLYKECSQSYMNAIRLLASILRKNEVDEAETLMKRLEEFTSL